MMLMQQQKLRSFGCFITTAITNYSTDLEVFDTVFRYSPFVTLIDEVDTAILSNITNIKISKTFKPTLASALKYTISFSNAFLIHIQVMQQIQQELQQVVFFRLQDLQITGDANTYYLEDDGELVGKCLLYFRCI